MGKTCCFPITVLVVDGGTLAPAPGPAPSRSGHAGGLGMDYGADSEGSPCEERVARK